MTLRFFFFQSVYDYSVSSPFPPCRSRPIRLPRRASERTMRCFLHFRTPLETLKNLFTKIRSIGPLLPLTSACIWDSSPPGTTWTSTQPPVPTANSTTRRVTTPPRPTRGCRTRWMTTPFDDLVNDYTPPHPTPRPTTAAPSQWLQPDEIRVLTKRGWKTVHVHAYHIFVDAFRSSEGVFRGKSGIEVGISGCKHKKRKDLWRTTESFDLERDS